jgi:hypothetical protein
MSTSLEIFQAIRDVAISAGYRHSHELFDFEDAAETILDGLFILLPAPTTLISKSGTCTEYKRGWALSVAFGVGRSERSLFEADVLDAEKALVDLVLALESVPPDGVRVAYHKISEGRYIIMELSITTQYERISV